MLLIDIFPNTSSFPMQQIILGVVVVVAETSVGVDAGVTK
jgi:hypothetical protein